MAKTEPKQTNPGEQSIEDLRKRYQGLHTKKIQAETQRDSAEHRLDELKAQAREKYGTDDVGQLQQKFNEMIEENASKRAKYQQDLDKIEAGLAEVEQKFSDAAPAPANPNHR